LIRESWAKALTLGDETVGVLLFKNIFEAAPGVKKYFSFKDIPDENLYEST